MDGHQISLEDRFSRRSALLGTAAFGSAFALAAQPVQAQTMIVTPSDGLAAGEVTVKTDDGKEMKAYRAMPSSGSGFGTILVVQEIFGVHAHIADMCRRFAKAGYYAIAADLYFRLGDATKVSDVQTLVRDWMGKSPEEQVMKDLDSTASFARTEGKADVGKLGVTGFCWGGRQTWLYDGHSPAVKAGVAWYGPLTRPASPITPKNPIDLVKELHGPVLGLYGGADAGIPQDQVEQIRAALKASGNPAAEKSEINVYADAPHGFNADYRSSYRKEAAEDGWKRCLAWFKSNGVV